MSELRERFAKTNALENMNRNAKITDVSIDLSFSFDWDGEQRRDILVGTVRDKDKYKCVSGEEKIDRKLAGKLCTKVRKNKVEDSEWLEAKQDRRENTLIETDLKNVNGEVYLTPTIYKVHIF